MTWLRRPDAEQSCSHERYRVVLTKTGQVPIEVHRCSPRYQIAMMLRHVLGVRCA